MSVPFAWGPSRLKALAWGSRRRRINPLLLVGLFLEPIQLDLRWFMQVARSTPTGFATVTTTADGEVLHPNY